MDCMQRDKLQKLFEEHRGKRGFLQLIAEAMGGSFRKSQISTHLRKLGLKQSQASIPRSTPAGFSTTKRGRNPECSLVITSWRFRHAVNVTASVHAGQAVSVFKWKPF